MRLGMCSLHLSRAWVGPGQFLGVTQVQTQVQVCRDDAWRLGDGEATAERKSAQVAARHSLTNLHKFCYQAQTRCKRQIKFVHLDQA